MQKQIVFYIRDYSVGYSPQSRFLSAPQINEKRPIGFVGKWVWRIL